MDMAKENHNEKLAAIQAQLSRYSERGKKDLLITPGNYGEGVLADKLNLNLENMVKCGGFIGKTIDMAAELGINSLLLAGHLGRMIQIVNGIQDVDERQDDDSVEVLADCVLLAGGDAGVSQRLLYCNTMDEAVEALWMTAFLQPAVAQLMRRAGRVLADHAGARIQVEALAFSNRYGMLGKTPGAEELIMLHRKLL